MSPGSIGGDVQTGDASPSSGAPVEAVDAAPGGDENFAFPGDFESAGDEPVDQEGAQPSDAAPPAQQPSATPSGARPQPAAAQPPAQRPAAQPAQPPQPRPQQPPAAQQPPQAAQPPQQRAEDLGPRALAERLAQNRDQLINHLANDRFKVQLTEAENTALQTDAIAALPQILSRLGAQLYYDMVTTSLNHIQNFVPRLVNQGMIQSAEHTNAEQGFWATYPQLDRNDPNVVRTVSQFANFYRQSNPQATQAEAIQQVGKAAAAFLGIALRPAPAANGQAPRRGSPPFAPAGAAGRVVASNPVGAGQPSSDPWAGMGLDLD